MDRFIPKLSHFYPKMEILKSAAKLQNNFHIHKYLKKKSLQIVSFFAAKTLSTFCPLFVNHSANYSANRQIEKN